MTRGKRGKKTKVQSYRSRRDSSKPVRKRRRRPADGTVAADVRRQSPKAKRVSVPTSKHSVRQRIGLGDAPTKYVFVDVVRFSERHTEVQKSIISALNQIIRQAMQKCKIRRPEAILLATGDGVCIALPNCDKFDAHVELALVILSKLAGHNAQADDDGHFELRVGVNSGTDIIVDDINGKRNVAGAAINMAQRVMSVADGGQLIVGQSVFEDMTPRRRYDNCFTKMDAVVKHDRSATVYQYTAAAPGLNVGAPSRVGSGARNAALQSVLRDDFLRNLSDDQLASLEEAAQRTRATGGDSGELKSYLDVFEEVRALPVVWRKQYTVSMQFSAAPGHEGIRKTRMEWNWTYAHRSGSDYPIEQAISHSSRGLPANIGDEWFKLDGVWVNDVSMIDRVEAHMSIEGDTRAFSGKLKLTLEGGKKGSATRIRYVLECLERVNEPIVSTVHKPVNGFTLELDSLRGQIPRLYVMGMRKSKTPTDPLPYSPRGEDRYRWDFDGWLLPHQGYLLMLGADDSSKPVP